MYMDVLMSRSKSILSVCARLEKLPIIVTDARERRCRDCLNWHPTPVFSGELVQKVYNTFDSRESFILARRPACIRPRDVQ